MSKIDEFKVFAKANPTFANYIKDGSMTWQKFYELYDMYGEDKSVWDEYLKNSSKEETKASNNTFNEFLNMAKNMDVDKVQSGITSLQKAISLFGDLFISSKTGNNSNNYEPRPIYKRFDD